MNATTKQQLMDKVIRAIARDSSSSQAATASQLRHASERLADEVRKVESTFQRATPVGKAHPK